MIGLTVRWSLAHAPAGVEEALAAYVADTSHARFSSMPGLQYKTWRLRRGEWFEGSYVFADSVARERFQAEFTQAAPSAPGSLIIGSAPILIEPCDVVAIAEGEAGFRAAARA
jgi:hypothetical protein